VTLMARERTASFDLQTFLAIVGSGKTILKVKKHSTSIVMLVVFDAILSR
jgi:hypothetical protein